MTTNNDYHDENGNFDYNAWKRDRDALAAPLTARVDTIRYNRRVHIFVIESLDSMIDMISYGSDSTVDEYGSHIDDVLNPEQCAINNRPYGECEPSTSVEWREYRSYQAHCEGILNELTPVEIEILDSINCGWDVIDSTTEPDVTPKFIEIFNAAVDRIKEL